MPWVERDLPVALGRLSDRERAAVVLVHGVGWSYAEVADLFGIGKSTVQKHVDRGMGKLRRRLGVTTDAD
jgi:RNA polymerase sigma factor (sigma-70 family)